MQGWAGHFRTLRLPQPPTSKMNALSSRVNVSVFAGAKAVKARPSSPPWAAPVTAALDPRPTPAPAPASRRRPARSP